MKIKPRIRVYSIIVPDRYYDPESKTGKFTRYFGFELLSRNFTIIDILSHFESLKFWTVKKDPRADFLTS